MKLLTLNTHSLVETEYKRKLKDFIDVIERERPEMIALQEVNQSKAAAAVSLSNINNYVPAVDQVIVKSDNHIYQVSLALKERGIDYYWTWLPIKLGYGIYDEGIGIMSRKPITEVCQYCVSRTDDYHNWRTRKILGVRIEDQMMERWFYSCHMGWWNDEEESFFGQWQRLMSLIDPKPEKDITLMGDFNNPAHIRNEGYDQVLQSGFLDTYIEAGESDWGMTVTELIDGWKDQKDLKNMRIDFIFQNQKREIHSSKVIFSGKREPVVSDHFGVMVIEGEKE